MFVTATPYCSSVQILRDRQQKVATAQLGDRDVFGLKVGPSGGTSHVFAMRGGRVVERVELATDPGALAGASRQPLLHRFGVLDLKREIDLGRRVRILVPQRGDKRALVDLATRNAELAYRTRFNEITAAHFEALETLRAVLSLPTIPRRIDCFDISTIQGSETVASMVVCEDGRLKRSEYKKFRIRGAAQDDFAAMREVVYRRYRKVLEDGGPFPDLILIDGGRGQLSAAYEALETIGLGNLVAVGIAKKEEVIFTRERPEPVVLPGHDPALLLIQRIRDEAHRFAITFHRKARSMRDLRSELDDVPGIGPRRRRALLRAFGSLAGVRRATREELESVVGAKTAAAVIDYFSRAS